MLHPPISVQCINSVSDGKMLEELTFCVAVNKNKRQDKKKKVLLIVILKGLTHREQGDAAQTCK